MHLTYVGAVLSQIDEENVDHPVAYFSIFSRELRFSVIENECLAIKMRVEACLPVRE